MALNAQKCREALAGLGNVKPVFIEPPPEFQTWLTQKQLPGDVIEFLHQTAVVADITFPSGRGGMWPPGDIMGLNDQEVDILAGGLLAVGNCANGDFIVIDLHDERRQAGFVSHDELWEGTAWTDVRQIFVPVADSLDEMLARMSADLWKFWRGEAAERRYPSDYSEALSWKTNK